MALFKDRAAKAYLNEKFLTSPEGRILRILSEYIEPRSRMAHARVKDTIVFFGSARIQSPEDAEAQLRQLKNAGDLATQTHSMSEDVTLELEEATRRAKMHLQLSRYYNDAVE